MRQDGHASFYNIEHYGSPGGNPTLHAWVGTDLGHMLMRSVEGKSWEERRARAAYVRKITAPQEASSDLWQTYGINGFEELADAEVVLDELRSSEPDEKFRIVKQQIVQLTEVIAA